MTCLVFELLTHHDPNVAEMVGLVVDDHEGYDDFFAAEVLGELTSREVDEQDVKHHRNRECACA